MKRHLATLILFMSGICLNLSWLMAQSPTHIDTRSKEPTPFSLDDILLYIVAPVLLLLIALWYRYYQNRKKQEKEERESK